jgi:hypothetical protein
MKIYNYIILAFFAILIPTLNGDSAFYLTKLSAERALNDNIYSNIWSISYGGLFEYLIRTLINSTITYIIFYKLLVIFINFYIYNKIYKENNIALKLGSFLALQFYLSPSEYSYVVGGLSAIVLSTRTDLIISKTLWIIVGLILLGFDLPNPKYLGLGLLLYISIQILKDIDYF